MWRRLDPAVPGPVVPEHPLGKVQLRRQIRARRADRTAHTTPAARATVAKLYSELITSELRRHRILTPGATVAAYQSLPTEPPTEALLTALRQARLRVLVPHLLPDKDLDWVEVRAPDEPLGLHAIADAAVIIVPALGIDRGGGRLGQGGGSYDRALPRRDPHARIIAMVNDDETFEQLPTAAHDIRVDAVCTPRLGVHTIDARLRD